MVRDMKKFKTLALAAAVSAGVLGSAGVMAAVNPSEPSNDRSEGQFDITFFNETKIVLYGLDDIDLYSTESADVPGSVDFDNPSPGQRTFTPICVASNIGSGDSGISDNYYEIALWSTNDFQLENSAGTVSVPYSLTLKNINSPLNKWGGGDGSAGGDYYENDVLVADSTDIQNSIQADCPSDTARGRIIDVELTGTDTVAAGVYSDTVTVVVAPR